MTAFTELVVHQASARLAANDTGEVLTADGKEFALPPEQQQVICYFSDGRILVSKTHQGSPFVLSFLARLRRMQRPVQVIESDLSSIKEAYLGNGRAAARAYDPTQMQQEAKELLKRGVRKRASDIHIRVEGEITTIWMRIHNDLLYQEEHVRDYGEKLCSTIYQSMTDVSEPVFQPREPQDARIADKDKLPSDLHGVRIATAPTVGGFFMVLRLLYDDAKSTVGNIEALGYNLRHAAMLRLMKARPTGINVIAGPVGSGKSTTLQRVLSGLIEEKQRRINVITIEDPVEYPIDGANQVPVSNAGDEQGRETAFLNAIRAAMRLDPNVIMIGEVRDRPSGELALRAAMTGNTVWTTLHANDAISIIDRLAGLKMPINLLADPSVLSGLVCQRLVKTLCPDCRIPFADVMKTIEAADPRLVHRVVKATNLNGVFVRGRGCRNCGGRGILGRTVVAEMVIPDHAFLQFIREGKKLEAVDYWKREQHGQTMLQHCIDKINQGVVDPMDAEEQVGPLTMGSVMRDRSMTAEEIGNVA